MNALIVRFVRFAACVAVLLTIAARDGEAGAREATVVLADPLPAGVEFQTLAVGEESGSASGVETLVLRRILVECGHVTGEIAGGGQLAYVEYGQVEVRDWTSGEVIATLSAGEAFGPTAEGRPYYLASPPGRRGSVLHVSTGPAETIGEELPAVAFQTTSCGSGVTQPMEARPAAVETLVAGAAVGEPDLDAEVVFYVGLLTVAPGAAIGQPYESGADLARYAATGTGAVLPLVGGFGAGSVGIGGAGTVPEIGPGEAAAMVPGAPVALENFGAVPTVALLMGVVPAGSPIVAEV